MVATGSVGGGGILEPLEVFILHVLRDSKNFCPETTLKGDDFLWKRRTSVYPELSVYWY